MFTVDRGGDKIYALVSDSDCFEFKISFSFYEIFNSFVDIEFC